MLGKYNGQEILAVAPLCALCAARISRKVSKATHGPGWPFGFNLRFSPQTDAKLIESLEEILIFRSPREYTRVLILLLLLLWAGSALLERPSHPLTKQTRPIPDSLTASRSPHNFPSRGCLAFTVLLLLGHIFCALHHRQRSVTLRFIHSAPFCSIPVVLSANHRFKSHLRPGISPRLVSTLRLVGPSFKRGTSSGSSRTASMLGFRCI
ncbi:hypothetical protein BDW67DRAFT_20839 [Aspergillus spinulosporus]